MCMLLYLLNALFWSIFTNSESKGSPVLVQKMKLLKQTRCPTPHFTDYSKIKERQAQLACSLPEGPQNHQADLFSLTRMVWPRLTDEF